MRQNPYENKTKILTKAFLELEYVINKKSTTILAKELNLSHRTILNYLEKHNILYRNKTTNVKKSLIGERFGKYTVISFSHVGKFNRHFYICKCDCGNKSTVGDNSLREGKSHQCSDCGINNKECPINRNKNCEKFDNITYRYFNRIKSQAAKRGIEFKLSIEDLNNQFIQQNGKCRFSGIALIFTSKKIEKAKQNASLDRIDSSKGYEVGNIQWVDKIINIMKRNMTDTKFIEICNSISQFNQIFH